jgi:hypothetical protein
VPEYEGGGGNVKHKKIKGKVMTLLNRVIYIGTIFTIRH